MPQSRRKSRKNGRFGGPVEFAPRLASELRQPIGEPFVPLSPVVGISAGITVNT
jgi:hypothetical protein